MSLNGIGAPAERRPVALSRSADEAAPVEQRALVPVQEPTFADSHGPYSRRPSAPFLAQLIATAQHAPQTREKRRTTPALAAHAYATALKLGGQH